MPENIAANSKTDIKILVEDFNGKASTSEGNIREDSYIGLKDDITTDKVYAPSNEIARMPTRSVTDMKAQKSGANPKDSRNAAYLPPVEPSKNEPVEVRSNLQETVFFYPKLQKDNNGEYVIKFKMNDALTRWKFMLFAHDKNMNYAIQEHYIVTQKQLMIQPNAPRFLRQGDTILFPAKISNLTDKEMKGEANLQFFDAFTDQPLKNIFGKGDMVLPFSIKPQENTVVYYANVIGNYLLKNNPAFNSLVSNDDIGKSL